MTFSDSNILLRPVSSQDTEQLVSLWNRVFGDPPALIERFLSLLPEMGCGSVAERDSRILGSAYLIHGFELLVPGEASVRCGYLYAVAVDEDSRGKGLGRELSRAAVSYGKENGAELICTFYLFRQRSIWTSERRFCEVSPMWFRTLQPSPFSKLSVKPMAAVCSGLRMASSVLIRRKIILLYRNCFFSIGHSRFRRPFLQQLAPTSVLIFLFRMVLSGI